MKRVALLVCLLAYSSLTPFVSGRPVDESAASLDDLMKQRRDAARKTYDVLLANYREGRGAGELLYRWSKRWLEAEKLLSEQKTEQIAALTAHLERMTELEQLVRKLRGNRLVPIDELSSAEFYRTEAEIWLLEAKKAAKK